MFETLNMITRLLLQKFITEGSTARRPHMPSLPQLLEEDVQEINTALQDLLVKSEATAALVAAEGGFLIFQQGDTIQFDATTLSAWRPTLSAPPRPSPAC